MSLQDLKAPFPPADIEWRAGSTNRDKTRALALAYITARAVMNRLDDVCGPDNWRDEYTAGPSGGVLCGLSIKVGEDWITKWDGAENTQFEGIKGGLSDAFKRAAVKWGIGRYLYNLDAVWVPCEQKGKSVVLKETPTLPKWALPEGMTSPEPTPQKPPAASVATEKNGRPWSALAVREALKHNAAAKQSKGQVATEKQTKLVQIMLADLYSGDTDHRHTATNWLFGQTSTKLLLDGELLALLDWMKPEKNAEGHYIPSEYAIKEAQSILTEALKDEGQGELFE